MLASRSRPRIERCNECRRSVLLPLDSRTLLVTLTMGLIFAKLWSFFCNQGRCLFFFKAQQQTAQPYLMGTVSPLAQSKQRDPKSQMRLYYLTRYLYYFETQASLSSAKSLFRSYCMCGRNKLNPHVVIITHYNKYNKWVRQRDYLNTKV